MVRLFHPIAANKLPNDSRVYVTKSKLCICNTVQHRHSAVLRRKSAIANVPMARSREVCMVSRICSIGNAGFGSTDT
jgi:hypothetical protein